MSTCPKCKHTSGDDWSQCGDSCPMPMNPNFKPVVAGEEKPTIILEGLAFTEEEANLIIAGRRELIFKALQEQAKIERDQAVFGAATWREDEHGNRTHVPIETIGIREGDVVFVEESARANHNYESADKWKEQALNFQEQLHDAEDTINDLRETITSLTFENTHANGLIKVMQEELDKLK